MFSKKATKIEEIFAIDLIVCSKCQIDGEDFIKFCGLLRKHKLYHHHVIKDSANKLRLDGNKFTGKTFQVAKLCTT